MSVCTLYGIKACDTCRKARQVLEAAGKTVEFRDVREAPLSGAEISRFLDAFGEDLINRRSTTWRNLTDAAREAPASELLIAHPTLMKRPVIEGAGGLTMGWSDAVRRQHLGD